MHLTPHHCLAAPRVSKSHGSEVAKRERLISHEHKARLHSSIQSSQLCTLSRPATREGSEHFRGLCPHRFLPKCCWSRPCPEGSRVPLPPRLLPRFSFQCQGEICTEADLQSPPRARPAHPLGHFHSAGKLLPKRAQSFAQKRGVRCCWQSGEVGAAGVWWRGWLQPGQPMAGAGASRPWLGRLCRGCCVCEGTIPALLHE